jgi:glutaredoxin 3
MAAKVELFFRDFCPFCSRAQRLLKSKNIEIEEINIWEEPARKKDMMARSGGKTSVPQVFVNGKHLGDCDYIFNLEMSGKLDAALGLK